MTSLVSLFGLTYLIIIIILERKKADRNLSVLDKKSLDLNNIFCSRKLFLRAGKETNKH